MKGIPLVFVVPLLALGSVAGAAVTMGVGGSCQADCLVSQRLFASADHLSIKAGEEAPSAPIPQVSLDPDLVPMPKLVDGDHSISIPELSSALIGGIGALILLMRRR